MTDSNDDNRRGRPPGRSDRGRTSSGDRPPRTPRDGGDRPFRARGDDDRPRKPREGGDRPFRSRDGDKPFRPRGEGGDKPFRSRDNDDRPRRFESGDKKPFRPRGEGGDKPFRARSAGDKPFRGRSGDERPRHFDRSAEDRPRRAREERPEVQAEPQEPTEDRIAKVIARAGVASRRDVEAMIAEGRVTLNGEVLASPAINVTAADRITVDGEPLPAKERTRLWLFHKPRGLVTTARDPQGRPTVFDSLPEELPRVVTVGRLDINTEGLLLLTNDGGLARTIAHPETGWLRRYKVRAHGEVTQDRLDALSRGISIDGVDYGPIEARVERVQGDNLWITMGLREGKNREIKNVLEHLGLQVNRLIRLSFGPFQLGDLEPGLVEEIRTKVLRDQLGDKLAAEAGVDFESPVREPIAPFGSPKRQEPEAAPRRDRSERRERPERPQRQGERFGRGERSDRGERGARPERGRAPPRGGKEERGPRPERGRADAAPRQEAPRGAARRSVWRDDDVADPNKPRGARIPRRGADPKAARAASAERPHQRVGAIEGPEGRKVRVERLVATPTEERRPTRGRRDGQGRGVPAGDDRPRRHGVDERPPRRFDEAPRRGERSERPRPPAGAPHRGGPPGARPERADARGARPERGGFRGERAGPGAGFRGDGPRKGAGGFGESAG